MNREAFDDVKERKKVWDEWGLESEVMLLVPYEVYVNLEIAWMQIGKQIFDFDFLLLGRGYYSTEWKQLRGFYQTLSQVGITVNKHILYELIVYFFAVGTRRREWEIMSHELRETTTPENFSEMKETIEQQKEKTPIEKWQELFIPVERVFGQKLYYFGLPYFFDEVPDVHEEEYRFLYTPMRYIAKYHLRISIEKWKCLKPEGKADMLDYKWRMRDRENQIKALESLYRFATGKKPKREYECKESPKEDTSEASPIFTGEVQHNTTTKPKKKK